METTTTAFIPPAPKPVAQSAPVVQPAQTTQQPVQQNQTQPIQTITASDGAVLDAGVVNLSKAIRQQESGGNYNAVGDNGTSHGAYQWQPGNFSADAKQFGLDPNDFSPVNQDKVAYAQINAYKQAGYSPEQIASLWNSGKPDATGNVGVKTINGKPVNYDTPKYVANVMNYFQQNKIQNPGVDPNQQTENQTQQEESPSVGGFAGNVVKSGANFVGNIADAVLHPIQTVQNIGGAGVGALQELGGQTNDNTVKFDALKGYFENRYGSVDNLLHTAYTDPVGLAGDISAVLGVGGGVASAVGKVGELGGAESLAEGAGATANALDKASELTNPLTPIIKGAGALLNKTTNLSDIIANPQNYTPEEMANSSSESIAKDVQDAFDAKRVELSETGSGYTPFKETPTPIQTSPDFLDNTLRDTLKLNVKDGIIEPTSTSLLRNPTDIAKLQSVYNTYKGDFLNGTMDSEKLLNLRTDLAKTAFNDLGIKNTDVAQATAKIRGVLNDTYRSQVPGLNELDSSYSAQTNKINELEDGLVYKTGAHKGELKDSFINKAGKALKTEDADKLAQLEEISPGITKRLQVMKTLKDLGSAYSPLSITEKAGTIGALLTGNLKVAVAGFTSMILSKPEIAVPLLRAVGANIELVKGIMANLAKYTTLSVIGNTATSGSSDTTSPTDAGQTTGQQDQQPVQDSQSETGTPEQQSQLSSSSQSSSSPNPTTSPADVQALAVEKNFNYTGAKKSGYTDQEIADYLKNS